MLNYAYKFLSMTQYLLRLAQNNERIVQFLRYILVGAIMLLLNLLLVWYFVQFWHMHYLVASSIAFVFESIAAFFANRRWTFQTSTQFRKGYVKFFTIAFYSFIVVLFITYGLVHFLAFQYVWARTASTVVAGFIGYFLDMKITFRV